MDQKLNRTNGNSKSSKSRSQPKPQQQQKKQTKQTKEKSTKKKQSNQRRDKKSDSKSCKKNQMNNKCTDVADIGLSSSVNASSSMKQKSSKQQRRSKNGITSLAITKSSSSKKKKKKISKFCSDSLQERVHPQVEKHQSYESLLNNRCIHVSESKWEEIWSTSLESMANSLSGLVFVNPNFARSYYIPSVGFRFDFDEFSEYLEVYISHNDTVCLARGDQYSKLIQTMIQSSSQYVSLHVCQVVEILSRFCVKCPNLVRLSFHYYYIDDCAIDYMADYIPNLISLNLENSVGLTVDGYRSLGRLQNLTHLNLCGCDVYEKELWQVFEHCEKLKSLNLKNNCSITGECLSHPTVRNLVRLNIQDCWRLTSDCLIDMCKETMPELIELSCNSAIDDNSLIMITSNCLKLSYLDISFEEFTYYDNAGFNYLTEHGFQSIARLKRLKELQLRHIGRLKDDALQKILESCPELAHLTLNLRHRHKLTDFYCLQGIGKHCPKLSHFEAVHNHFIGRHSLQHLTMLSDSLQVLILRGNELVKDDDTALLISKLNRLRYINLDGCQDVNNQTLEACIIQAGRRLKEANRHRYQDSNSTTENNHHHHQNGRSSLVLRASLIMTGIDRNMINQLSNGLPSNLRIRACDHRRNKVHFNEFDGEKVEEHQLREKFFPFYWHDYN